MKRLTNTIRPYAWGSLSAIAALQGRGVPSAGPEAELWMGAHPSAPSMVSNGDGGQIALTELVAADPDAVLGQRVRQQFGPRLPYLFKLLAAAQPLSLQAHPDARQAAEGYAAEQLRGVASDDPARNYVDSNHKPELLVAIEEFHALCGFRHPELTAGLLESLQVADLRPVVVALRAGPPAQALRAAVELLMGWPSGERAGLVDAVVASEQPLAVRLGLLYPGDLGVVLALLLNELRLRPNEAVYMPAGNLHVYLSGFGVEIMATSDNVLRGGLTPKRVDVAELLAVLRYEVLDDPVVRPVVLDRGLVTWPVEVADFALTRAEVPADALGDGMTGAVMLPGAGGPRILCCVRGPALLDAGGETVNLAGGESVFVGAGEPAVAVSGTGATVFQATTGS